MTHATHACEIAECKSAELVQTLAAAYAEAGDFEAAVKWQTKAVELASGDEKAEFKKKRDLFESRAPFRDDAKK